MRYASKASFVERMEREHARFLDRAEAIGEERFEEPGVWGDGWTVKDLFAHLTAWEQLFLAWHREGRAGRMPAMPAPGYKWNETPRLNRDIQAAHADDSWGAVRGAFDRSYRQIARLVASLDEEDVLEAGRFAWTGKKALTTYLGANTASHYATAAKILQRWTRGTSRPRRR